jgi:uncharacterized protein YukE
MAIDAGIKNVEELQEFGKQISQLGDQMNGVMAQAHNRLAVVSEGWHDETNEKFKARFEESVKQVKQMSEDFKAYAEYIRKTCEILEQYKANKLRL